MFLIQGSLVTTSSPTHYTHLLFESLIFGNAAFRAHSLLLFRYYFDMNWTLEYNKVHTYIYIHF